MYISDDFGEGIVSSSHRTSTDAGSIYTQCALRDIQSVNGVVVISAYELAYLIKNAFDVGHFTKLPEWGKSLNKAKVREMIDLGESFDKIMKSFE